MNSKIPVIFLLLLLMTSTKIAAVEIQVKSFALDSRQQNGLDATVSASFRKVIQMPGALWLRLRFSEYNLGQRSYLTITSLRDGGNQRLDSRTLPQWENATAIFNGDAVEVELHADPGDNGIYFIVDSVVLGEPQNIPVSEIVLNDAEAGEETLCGVDNRVASTDSRVGRLFFGGCTAWLISNGSLLTAGHCVDKDPDYDGPLKPDGILDLSGVVEFNVPPSLSNGATVAADPDDQYPINTSNVVWRYDGEGTGLGKDWAVFNVNVNSNTLLTPFQAQGSFFRTTNANPTAGDTIRITGMGLDETPAGSTGGGNAQNFTNQTSTGAYGVEYWNGPDIISHTYAVDTTGGNSGSPVIWDGYTIGIHTNAGCTTDGANVGTSFEVNALETAIDNHPGSNTAYVDKYGYDSINNGTIYHPFPTVNSAVSTVPAGSKVSIVRGSYIEAGIYNKQILMVAPVGDVFIGN